MVKSQDPIPDELLSFPQITDSTVNAINVKLMICIDSILHSLKKSNKYQYTKKLQNEIQNLVLTNMTIDEFNLTMDTHEEDLKKNQLLIRKLEAIAQRIRYSQRTNSKASFLPVRCQNDYTYYNREDEVETNNFLNETKAIYKPDDRYFTLYTELYKDYFNVIRLGIGSTVGANFQSQEPTSDSGNSEWEEIQQHNAFSKFTNGGGLIAIDLSYPIFYFNHEDGGFNLKTEIHSRIGLDPPGISNTNRNFIFNLENSFITKLKYAGSQDKINIIAESKIARVFGNDDFYTHINKVDQNSFAMYLFTIGIIIEHKFQLTWNFMKGGAFVNQQSEGSMGVKVDL